MNSIDKKKLLLVGFLLSLFVAIPLTLSLVKQQQETRSHAVGSTTLSFLPASTTSNPMVKNVGDNISLDMMVEPGSNLVTFIRFQVQYDSTKLQLAADPFTVNTTAFPNKVEGPVTSAGKIAESVSVGSDPTKAIQKLTKVGTLNFKAIAPTTNVPITITYTALTEVLSSGSTDQAAENVLSTTIPANIIIAGAGTVFPTQVPITPSITPIVTPNLTPNLTPGLSPTSSLTLTPQPTPDTTILSLNLLLHGVGSAGDNPNPKTSELSNKNPIHPQRDLTVFIYDSTNQLVASTSAPILYDAGAGTFGGEMDLTPTFKEGNYNIKIKTDRYLRRLVPGIVHIKPLAKNEVPVTDLVAGDVNGDNVLNVLDYNALLDCGYGQLNPLPMEDANSAYNAQVCQNHSPAVNVDIDDSGMINSTDYNLFIRELSVQNGD